MPRRTYTAEEIQRGLVALVYAAGNPSQAHSDLKEDGIKIPATTLAGWKSRTHAEEYERVRAEEGPKLRARALESHMSAIAHSMNVREKMARKLEREVDDIPARDLPGGIRNIDTSIGIHFDKAQIIMGEPTEIHSTKRVPDLIRSLKSKGIEIIEGDAEEEQSAGEPPTGTEESGEAEQTAA